MSTLRPPSEHMLAVLAQLQKHGRSVREAFAAHTVRGLIKRGLVAGRDGYAIEITAAGVKALGAGKGAA